MALVPVTVHLRNGVQVTVTGQQLSEHFAVTPSLAIGEDGTVGLADYGRALTHIPSGRAVTHDTLFDFAGLVTELEALPIDWGGLHAADDRAGRGDQSRLLAQRNRSYPRMAVAGMGG